MLSVVVDDHDLGVNFIIRGDDHLNNYFRQKFIYEYMNWEIPNYAHIPLIHGEDGSNDHTVSIWLFIVLCMYTAYRDF